MKKFVFDAVTASREWKQTVAETTAGMTMAERMAWFRSQSSIPDIRSRAKAPRRVKVHAKSS